MRRLYLLACLFLPMGVFGTPIDYNVNYTLTSNSDVITFSLPQQPVPLESCAFSTSCFSVTPTDLVIDGDPISNGIVSFYTPANSGGITIMEGETLLVNNGGPSNLQLFSGTLSDPVLKAFSNLQLTSEDFGSPTLDEAFFLNANVPEPGTFKLLFPVMLISVALLGRRSGLVRKAPGSSNQSV